MKAFQPAIARPAPRACGWRATRAARAGGRWPALQLQWRRSPRPQSALRAAARPATPSASWQTSMHLHFNVLRRSTKVVASRAQALPAAAQGMHLKETRVVNGATRLAPAIMAMSPARTLQIDRTPAALAWRARGRAAHASTRTPGATRVEEQASAADRAAASPMTQLAFTRQPQSAPQLAWKVTPAAARRALLRTNSAPPAPPGQSAAVEALLWQTGAPSLVWRKPGAAAASAQEPAHPASMAFAAPADAQRDAPVAAAAPAPAPAPAVLAQMRRQLQAAPLDPALADRLADEVIRRVERSMRIERERRGH